MAPRRSHGSTSCRVSYIQSVTDEDDSEEEEVLNISPRPRRSKLLLASSPRMAAHRSSQAMRSVGKTSSSSKLRETTSADYSSVESNKRSSTRAGREAFAGGEILSGKRSRPQKSYVVASESDDDEDDEEDGGEGEDDEDDEEDDDDEDDDEDAEDAEGEDVEMSSVHDEDAEGEEDDDGAPPPPSIKVSKAPSGKLRITAKPSGKSNGKTVEQQEADASDDELSELDSDEVEDVEEEDAMQTGGDEDAEGDDEEMLPGGADDAAADGEEVEEDDDEPMDSDDDTPADGSRASTPDLSKLTKRQRARFDEGGDNFLMKLPDEPQVKKHLTAEEHAMRRAEMARRRKNLSEKRNEEEKMETINKLLKKQAPKTNARRKDLLNSSSADGPGAGGESALSTRGSPTLADKESARRPPDARFVRWVSDRHGCRVGVPMEWLGAGPLDVFGGVDEKQAAKDAQQGVGTSDGGGGGSLGQRASIEEVRV